MTRVSELVGIPLRDPSIGLLVLGSRSGIAWMDVAAHWLLHGGTEDTERLDTVVSGQITLLSRLGVCVEWTYVAHPCWKD
jgi:hypothetical protein